jgi:hypothetical protein
MAGYDVAIDLRTAAAGRPLDSGMWSIHVSIGNAAIHRSVPVRAPRRARDASDEAAPKVVKGGGLRTNRAGSLRLRIGRTTAVDRLLERAEDVYLRVSRRFGKALAASRVGRLTEMVLERTRPGMAARLVDD